jgi:hypothetical protein
MNRRVWAFVLLGMLAVLTVAGGVLAASADSFDLGWHVVAGGGGVSSSAGYALHGTAGQPAAGVLSGGGYVLGSGFWGGGEVVHGTIRVYLPVVMRNH